MTSQQLVSALTAAELPAFLDAAPPTLSRYIVVSPYAETSILGDDSNIADIEKVQLDICAPTRSDMIVASAKGVLQNNFLVWETVTPLSYDPEFKLFRAILQLELY